MSARGGTATSPAPREATPGRYPVFGVVMLDAMAAIAGPTWNPDHARAWQEAFEIVLGATRAGPECADRRPSYR